MLAVAPCNLNGAEAEQLPQETDCPVHGSDPVATVVQDDPPLTVIALVGASHTTDALPVFPDASEIVLDEPLDIALTGAEQLADPDHIIVLAEHVDGAELTACSDAFNSIGLTTFSPKTDPALMETGADVALKDIAKAKEMKPNRINPTITVLHARLEQYIS